MSVAPPGLTNMQTMSCGSCSVEFAFKLVFMRYMRKQRGGVAPSQEELESCIMNQAPGSPPLSILSFKGGLHGRTMGSAACSHTKWPIKLDFPAPEWPVASFPDLKYPLEDHVSENKAEEARCLAETGDLLEQWSKKGRPVVGVIIEPIQAEGGDKFASAEFFQGLRDITNKHDIALIMDEVQTGCGPTGKFWAHQHFNLSDSPDIVTFSKKMLTGGFLNKEEYRPAEPNRIFNTWLGDPSKLLLTGEVIKVIQRDNLLNNVKVTGDYLLAGLKDMQKKYPGYLRNARGLGTFCSVDLPDVGTRDKVIYRLRQRGVNTGACGTSCIRFRPALIFKKHHVDIFLEHFDAVLENMQN